MWYLEKNHCLSNSQSGFRKGRSTTDCLVKLTSDLQEAVIQNKHTIVVFFDIMKAYDTAWKHGILMKLHQFGLEGNLPIFIQNFLMNRKIQVRVRSATSSTMAINEGVPQGSVLSCTLFAIAIDHVIRALPPSVKATLYVDDLTIYASGSKSMAERQIQTAINKLTAWCNKSGFQFSASKTVCMHVCRQRDGMIWCQNPSPELKLGKEVIPTKSAHTYLGVIIDQRLKWDKHVEYIKNDCKRRMTLFKHISHADWGADTKTLLKIYQAFILPKIEYGVEAYGSACATTLSKLDPIQNQCLRTATGAFRTSPINSLEVIAGFKSLKESRDEKFAKYIVRALASPTNIVKDILQEKVLPILDEPNQEMTILRKNSFLQRSKEAILRININQDAIWIEEPQENPPWGATNLQTCENPLQGPKGKTHETILKNMFSQHIRTHISSRHFYTDGSKTKDGTAFAAVEPASNTCKARKMAEPVSVFTAELTAIHYCIVATKSTTDEAIVIFSDSKSSIQAISSPQNKHPLITAIRSDIYASKNQYCLCWVPSHVGVSGNEAADKLARDHTKDNNTMANLLIQSDVKNHIKQMAKVEWKQRWSDTTQQNKLRQITDGLTPLPNTSCSNRRWERVLTRLRLGHTRLTHGPLLTNGALPTCGECGDEERLSVKHILTECEAYRHARLRCFQSSNLTLKSILVERDTSPGGPLAKFISMIGMMNSL